MVPGGPTLGNASTATSGAGGAAANASFDRMSAAEVTPMTSAA